MPLKVVTNDATALTDTDLDEMASIEGYFDIGAISKSKEEWVLSTTARDRDNLEGFMFSTLERIGGTPCVLIGMFSVRRNDQRESTMRDLMKEAYHRALMAFPDEDVVVAARFTSAGAVVAFDALDDLVPDPAEPPVGEERAWGRRLAKRFGVDKGYDAKQFITQSRQTGFLDYLPADKQAVDTDIAKMFEPVDADDGSAMIVYGWTMAEDLVKLGAK